LHGDKKTPNKYPFVREGPQRCWVCSKKFVGLQYYENQFSTSAAPSVSFAPLIYAIPSEDTKLPKRWKKRFFFSFCSIKKSKKSKKEKMKVMCV